jgi:hypothetical protein
VTSGSFPHIACDSALSFAVVDARRAPGVRCAECCHPLGAHVLVACLACRVLAIRCGLGPAGHDGISIEASTLDAAAPGAAPQTGPVAPACVAQPTDTLRAGSA